MKQTIDKTKYKLNGGIKSLRFWSELYLNGILQLVMILLLGSSVMKKEKAWSFNFNIMNLYGRHVGRVC